MKSLVLIILLLTTSLAQSQNFDYRPERPSRPERPERPDRGDRLIIKSLGSLKTNKFVAETFSFYPSRYSERAYQIELVGLRGNADIKSVQIQYGNGEVEELYELRGTIKKDRKNRAALYGRYVQEVRIVAISELIGSRGVVQVNLGVLR